MFISLAFQLQRPILPSREEHFGTLWEIAQLLQPFGLPIDIWRPPARTRKKSLVHAAFDHNGPTSTALEIQRVQDEKDGMTNYRRTGVWSGNEKGIGGALHCIKIGTKGSALDDQSVDLASWPLKARDMRDSIEDAVWLARPNA